MTILPLEVLIILELRKGSSAPKLEKWKNSDWRSILRVKIGQFLVKFISRRFHDHSISQEKWLFLVMIYWLWLQDKVLFLIFPFTIFVTTFYYWKFEHKKYFLIEISACFLQWPSLWICNADNILFIQK